MSAMRLSILMVPLLQQHRLRLEVIWMSQLYQQQTLSPQQLSLHPL